MFEYPKIILDRILEGEESGKMQDHFGLQGKGREGVIGVFSKGIIDRDKYDEMAVIMAITNLLNSK